MRSVLLAALAVLLSLAIPARGDDAALFATDGNTQTSRVAPREIVATVKRTGSFTFPCGDVVRGRQNSTDTTLVDVT